MSLPEPRDPSGPYRVCVVCLGNICRSPMAEKILTTDLGRAGLADRVRVDSAGTGNWHVGADMDTRAAATLRKYGYPTGHAARQFSPDWFAERDLVLAMDTDNLADLLRLAPDPETEARVRLFRSFAPDAGPNPEVPDPYYGGDDGFITVLNMIEAAAKGLTGELAVLLGSR
ncbi:low molecular weight phosphotyrosine protein phosphatase [Thermobifida halotolerans]|uniref:protein-tyrosine-phosphatase n=1 Tax=Thermobifida halotolerans TaxID=483545 RepID=A0A399FYM1_9ACTN|nr:low molecular weight protein-tyrosine-phosphatase [Thermobifida halotolerans]UOE18074.1 low molecular weight phosphotyrosine protein phosphatase [Thermobifida halotolerans]